MEMLAAIKQKNAAPEAVKSQLPIPTRSSPPPLPPPPSGETCDHFVTDEQAIALDFVIYEEEHLNLVALLSGLKNKS